MSLPYYEDTTDLNHVNFILSKRMNVYKMLKKYASFDILSSVRWESYWMAGARRDGTAWWCPAKAKPFKVTYFYDSGQGGPRDGCLFKKPDEVFLDLADCTETKFFFCIVDQTF